MPNWHWCQGRGEGGTSSGTGAGARGGKSHILKIDAKPETLTLTANLIVDPGPTI